LADKYLLNHFAFISEIPVYVILMLVGSLLPSIGFSLSALYSMPLVENQVQKIAMFLPLIFITLTLALTVFFYHRGIRTRIGKYKKLDGRFSGISQLVGKISKNLGVRKPVLLLRSEDRGINAAVFGGFMRKYLVVSRGLCEKTEHFPELVETILIHELSHIKNGDVVTHEIAESMWKSLAVMAPISWITWTVFTWLTLNRIDAPAWLIFSLLWYVIPAIAIFWLNGAISGLREIRADLRTVAFLKTATPLRDLLGILSFVGSGRTGVPDRLRIIERGSSFRDFLKVTFLASAVVAVLAYGITFPSPLPIHKFYWNPASSPLILFVPSIFLPKHVVSRLRHSSKSYGFFVHILADCFLIAAVSTIAKSLVDYFPLLALTVLDRSSTEWLIAMAGGPLAILYAVFYLIIQNFVLLFVCVVLIFLVYLMLSLREDIRGKLLMPLVCVLTVILSSVFYGSALSFFFVMLMLLLLFCLLILGLIYGRCPYCGENRKIYPFGIVRCTCSKVLNKGFFVSIRD